MIKNLLFSSGITKLISKNNSVTTEFANIVPLNSIQQGVYTQNGEVFQLQFDKLLIGEKRFLNFYIDIAKQFDNIQVIESDKQLDSTNKCHILFQRVLSMDDNDISNTVFYPTSPVPESPDSFLKAIPGKDQEVKENQVILAHLNLSLVYAPTVNAIIWTKTKENTWNSVKISGMFTDKPGDANFKIKHKIRNKSGNVMLNSLYVFTIPLDVVTFPLQMLALKGMVK